MSQSGATVSQECVTTYNELKLGKNIKYIIWKQRICYPGGGGWEPGLQAA